MGSAAEGKEDADRQLTAGLDKTAVAADLVKSDSED